MARATIGVARIPPHRRGRLTKQSATATSSSVTRTLLEPRHCGPNQRATSASNASRTTPWKSGKMSSFRERPWGGTWAMASSMASGVILPSATRAARSSATPEARLLRRPAPPAEGEGQPERAGGLDQEDVAGRPGASRRGTARLVPRSRSPLRPAGGSRLPSTGERRSPERSCRPSARPERPRRRVRASVSQTATVTSFDSSRRRSAAACSITRSQRANNSARDRAAQVVSDRRASRSSSYGIGLEVAPEGSGPRRNSEQDLHVQPANGGCEC